MASKVSDWVERIKDRKFKHFKESYEHEKEKIEEAMGKPRITITVEMPEGYRGQEKDFRELETDKEFLDEVEKLVKKELERKRKNRHSEE